MCIIALLPSKNNIINEITDDIFRNMWERNNDGCGFAYVGMNKKTNKKEVIIHKGFPKLNGFIKAFRIKRDEFPSSGFMIHFRFNSKGSNTDQNCHPFMISSSNSIAMCHNGTIHKIGAKDTGDSDSKIFADVLKKLPDRWWNDKNNEIYFELIDEYIGINNRMAFITSDNKMSYLGDGWIQEGDILYSNDYYKKKETNKITYFCTICRKQATIVFNGYHYCDECYRKRIEELNKVPNTKVLEFKRDTVEYCTCGLELLGDTEKKNKRCYHCEERHERITDNIIENTVTNGDLT